MRNTKSLLAIFLACMMVMSCIVAVPVVAAEVEVWDSTADPDTSWYDADPSATTFEIGTAAELAGLAKLVNEETDNFAGDTITLTADIYLNDVTDWSVDAWTTTPPKNRWTPIGYYSNKNSVTGFSGTFDGANHTIYGLYMDAAADPNSDGGRVGLFGCIYNQVTIKDVNISNAYVTGTNCTAIVAAFSTRAYTDPTDTSTQVMSNFLFDDIVVDNAYVANNSNDGVAAIFGKAGTCNSVTFNNCSVTNTTIGKEDSEKNYSAALFGYSSGTVTTISFNNCMVNADINGAISTAGLLGCAAKTTTLNVTDCYVGGTIEGTRGVGGVFGEYRQNTATVFDVSNTLINAAIKGTWGVGGVWGHSLHANAKMTVKNVVVTGSLETTGTDLTDSSRVGGTDIGALVGAFGFAGNTTTENVSINNFYYNATFTTADTTDRIGSKDTTNGRLGSFYGTSAVNADTSIEDGYVFYTPMTDTTSVFGGGTFTSAQNTVAKAADMGIADFANAYLSAVKDLAWFKANACTECTALELGANADGDEVVVTCDKMCANTLVKIGKAWEGGYATEWYNNGVTENGVTTYTISNADDLAGLAAIVNGTADGIEADDFAGDVIKLAANIYLNDTGSTANKWVPIGAYGAASGLYFRGTFDGQNKTIANMYIVDGNAYTGLFGYVGNGFNVKDLTISGANVAARNYGGILVSSIKEDVTEDMSFTNITVKDSVFSTNHANGGAAILGRVDTTSVSGKLTFENCSIVDTTVTGSKYLGGLVGYLKASTNVVIDGATVSGSVDATAGGKSDLMVGGLIGYVDGVASLNVTEVSVSSKITTDGARSGGIIGRIVGTTNCNLSGVEFSGSIEAYNNLGGFVGEANFTGTLNISDSTMSGSVAYVTSNNFYGGFIGSVNNANAVIELENLKLASTASVSGTGYVGGLVGAIRAVKSISIENCDVAGTISANNPVGAAIGGYHAASNAVTISGVNTTANITSNSSTHCGGIIGKLYTNSGTSIIENCRVATTGKNAGGLVGTVTGGTLTLGNNVVIGDYSEAAFVGNSGTVSQTTGTKIYVNGTVGNTAAVTTVTTADEAVVDFANAWGEATANYTAWSACSNCEGSGWIEKANAADGQYRVSCVDMCKGVTAEARSVSVVALGGSVRYLDPFGVRFGGRVYGAAEGSEYGVLMIPTTMLNGAELTVDNADALNALKIKAEKTFPSGEYYVDGAATFTGVVYDIPDTADAYDTQLTAVVYYTVDGVTYYSNVMTASYYDVAKLILADADWVAANSEAAATLQAVVDLVDAQ